MNLQTVLTSPLALWKTLFVSIFPESPLVHQQDHFAPHPPSGFEGYYSRTLLDNGGTLAIIFCWVKDAKSRGDMVYVSYHPTEAGGISEFQHVFFVDCINAQVDHYTPNQPLSFTLRAPSIGSLEVTPRSMNYAISVSNCQLDLTLSLDNPTPWSKSRPLEGPMGPFTHLSHLLPLNWTVHSISSTAKLTLTYSGQTHSVSGVTHMEKNWGTSFPEGWIWGQSFSTAARSFCLAGGAALPGVHAYLVGYRSAACNWDFRPPFTVSIGLISPFIIIKHDSRKGTVDMELRTFTRKLVVRMDAPIDSFLPFPAPLKEGHRSGYAYESFKARTWVEAWSRRWPWQNWKLIEKGFCGMTEDGTPCSALEFGGSFCHLSTAPSS
ncbi:hypothetical protein SCP_1103900 [Sparassis crispa]|uniref:Tocopherol cyclase n=1 Tax=Sparassis crispa TaxID=139825 RepID=A0A401GZW7_9APHY|nr:hypothetical protein SCP_1103900 [Sparassis crispa]GBE87713.1 hypothetical protein SCP_1103900 [Sparassis crispa]